MMSDRYGRNFLFKIGVFGQCLVFLCVMMTNYRPLCYFALLVEGALTPLIYTVGYVYMTEFLAKKWQDYVATIFCFIYAVVIVIITFYYQVISDQYCWVVVFGLLQMLIAFFISFFIVESPLWYLSKGKIKQA